MRAIGVVLLLLTGCTTPHLILYQTVTTDPTLEHRLGQLEQRVAHLEEENAHGLNH